MKTFVVSVMVLMSVVTNAQTISLLAGKSFSPADYLSLRYTHYSNRPMKLSLSGFYERGTKYKLGYGSYGADLLLHCDQLTGTYPERRDGLTGAIGVNWQVENESWLYKDWPFSKRSSFGIIGEVAYQYYLTDAFRIGLFSQQKILFNPDIGRCRWIVGLSLSHHLGY
jgi:hypothetical protein